MASIPIGGLSNNGAVPLGQQKSTPIPVQQPQVSGVINLGQSSATPISQGNVKGILTPGVNQTIKQDPAGNIYNPPKSSPSVLAQQQALNKLGAGLVEDGIAGDKTRAAIAKYGSGGSTTPPVITDSSKVTTGGTPISASAQTQASMVSPITGVNANNSTTQNTYTPPNQGTQGVSQGGLIGNAVAQSQGPSPEYLAQVAEANRIASERAKLTQDFAQQSNQIAGTAGFLTQQTGLQGLLQNQYNQGQGALSQQEASATSRLNAANTARQLEQSALSTALGANAPVQVSPTNVPFSPSSGTYGTPASSAYGSGGLAGVGAFQQQQDQGAQTQNMIGAYNQAAPLIQRAKQQIAAANFNVSPLALANQLQQYINKNVIPSGEYANIFNTLSEIATTISPVLGAQGAQTDLKTMIAQEFIPKLLQGSDINSVLDNIERNALLKINANKSTATGTPLQVPTSSGSSTGGSIWNF